MSQEQEILNVFARIKTQHASSSKHPFSSWLHLNIYEYLSPQPAGAGSRFEGPVGRASMFAEGGGHVVSVHLWEREFRPIKEFFEMFRGRRDGHAKIHLNETEAGAGGGVWEGGGLLGIEARFLGGIEKDEEILLE